MTPTMFGKVVEAASLRRKLPKSFLQIRQVWRRSKLGSPTMASLQHSQERTLSQVTSGGILTDLAIDICDCLKMRHFSVHMVTATCHA